LNISPKIFWPKFPFHQKACRLTILNIWVKHIIEKKFKTRCKVVVNESVSRAVLATIVHEALCDP